ncbi:hypothetical protein MKY63_10750 [Paenibacillus sp. FSL R7-0189]|uniref:hypothetical protein n=1 Tax=Paenibacillus sp. FSL R7-0189 TaxID=2921673 RepID=UPI0030DC1B80
MKTIQGTGSNQNASPEKSLKEALRQKASVKDQNSIEFLKGLHLGQIQDEVLKVKYEKRRKVIASRHTEMLVEQYQEFCNSEYVEYIGFYVVGIDGVNFDTFIDEKRRNEAYAEAKNRMQLYLEWEMDEAQIYVEDMALSVTLQFPVPVRFGGMDNIDAHCDYATQKIKHDIGLDVIDVVAYVVSDPSDKEEIFYRNIFTSNQLLNLMGLEQVFIPKVGSY